MAGPYMAPEELRRGKVETCMECGGEEWPMLVLEEMKGKEDVIEVDEEAENGSREVRRMNDPRLPTKQEVEDHNRTHLPFWS